MVPPQELNPNQQQDDNSDEDIDDVTFENGDIWEDSVCLPTNPNDTDNSEKEDEYLALKDGLQWKKITVSIMGSIVYPPLSFSGSASECNNAMEDSICSTEVHAEIIQGQPEDEFDNNWRFDRQELIAALLPNTCIDGLSHYELFRLRNIQRRINFEQGCTIYIEES